MGTLTSYLADVQDVANDTFSDIGGRLSPCDLQGVGGQSTGCEALGGSGQIFSLGHSQTGTSLVGAGTVLSNALVDGLILRADTGQSQSTVKTTQRWISSTQPDPTIIGTTNKTYYNSWDY